MDHALLTLGHTVCWILLLVFSFLTIAPMAVLITNFSGHCILGTKITHDNSSSHVVIAQLQNGSRGACAFPEVLGFAVLFMSIGYIVWNSCLLFNSWQSSWKESCAGTALSAITMFLLLIASAILSSAINQFCSQLQKDEHRCSTVNYRLDPSWLRFLDSSGKQIKDVHPTHFYNLLQITEVRLRYVTHMRWLRAIVLSGYNQLMAVGCWLSFLTFLVVTLLYNTKVRDASNGESLLGNFSRERQRIAGGNQRRYVQI